MIPAGTALNQPVCVYELQFGIVDDQIVEDSQSFSVVPSSVSPANTLTVSDSIYVTIQVNFFCSMILHKFMVRASLWTIPYPGVLKCCVKS